MTETKFDFSSEVKEINAYLTNLRNHAPYDDEVDNLINIILCKGGKRIRPLICLLSYEMISSKPREVHHLTAACSIEILHNASLLIDDLFDKDIYRRKEKSFYLKYSTFAALSVSYAMSSLALSLATQTQIMQIVEELVNAIKKLSSSLFLEQKLRIEGRVITKKEALQLIDMKTSCLFEAASVIGVILGAASKKDQENMKKFGKMFGRAFQLRDDLLSFTSTTEEQGKSGVETDLSNKIQTYIVLEAMENVNEEDKVILQDYYVNKGKYPVTQIKEIITNSPALRIVQKKMEKCIQEAIAVLQEFPSSIPRDKLIEITNLLQV